MVLLSMFDKAGGYKHDYVYFNEFQQRWQQSDPQQIIYAAIASKYPPDFWPIKTWCAETYPALAHVLWKPPTIRRLSCCESALDTLDVSTLDPEGSDLRFLLERQRTTHCTADAWRTGRPAFVHAPTLATVKSWSALRIILEEATEMDDICCQRIDPQDLNTPLHLPGPHGTGTGADNEHEEAEEEQPEGEEEEAAEDESSPDGHHDDDAPGAPDDPDDSTGPSATGLTTTLVDSGSGDSGGATGLDILDPTDPLNHAGSGTTMTAALPSSVMPGDMIYEVDDVSFNLSAASRCHERHREDQEMLPGAQALPQVQAGVKDMWQRWRAFKQVRKQGLRGIYQIIKRIAPKQEELQLLQEHFQHRFAAQDEEDQQLMQRSAPTQGGAIPMPRSKLYAGMCRLDLPQDLIHTLMAWHAEIRYTIRHADDQRTFRASQGIRQGCSVAPLLWLIFSHEVSCALEAKVGRDMIIRTLTIFADDYHMADAFTSLAAFEHLLDVVAVLFHVLTAFGMEVSAGKSKAILALRGTLSNTIRKKYVRPAPDGSGQVLRIQSRHQAFCIPLVSQFTYLGTQVSYSCFEQQTLTSRLAKGETCYHRLGAVLKGRHHLTQGVVAPAFIVTASLNSPDMTNCSALCCGNSALLLLVTLPPLSSKMTTPDQQHAEIFGALAATQAAAFGAALMESATHDQDQQNLPNKIAKLEGGGKRQRPRGGNPAFSSFGSHQDRGSRGPNLRQEQALIRAMRRLLLRQETSIQVLKQNSAWDLYLQPGPQGPIPMLFKTSTTYREESKSKRMDLPLRAQLLSTLFQTVLQCIQAVGTHPEQMKAVQAKGWMSQEGKWTYQRWDPSIQALIVDESRLPMEHQELVGLLGALVTAVRAKDVIHRFNATHPITPDQKGTSKFLLEVGLRAQGVAEVWLGLEKLQNLAALQVVGMQLRRDGLQRCNLAADIQKMLGDY
ncbi:hypothetical protein AK812_SmicGene42218 [Symbiodinium microadriaticum]|uniref:Reverse transcriptase domain-containing protein n=1 Tax=Symbiodinium microadriaticum TaxID=2951 RepID=A0A1Q9C458_SYMMI|nr:hypothetical protein AK812_SmicGene42218 [Symbiodinium microadriaticum]CAE7306460.1 unnamed protein product [Symbiodinium microadriaticum]CAE7308138.1 unnamed protein product [Symbiodinium sp. KB8]